MGGGTEEGVDANTATEGLSPRGRGNPMSNDIVDVPTGSIPAWAGEPTKGKDQQGQSKVYPRVGGGTLVVKGLFKNRHGLSPRGRGNRNNRGLWIGRKRSIPAWAGEPTSS